MKIELKISKNDKNILLPISVNNSLLGYDDNIQSIITDESNASINNVSDLEVRRFNFSGTTLTTTFKFWSGSGYSETILPLSGFTNISNETRNSFYVMQVYDHYDENIQSKQHTGYFNAYDFIYRATGLSSNYIIDNTSEFLSIYLENNFLENDKVELYVKFLFYNANTGKFHTFASKQYSGVTIQEDIYQIIVIDKNTFTYGIIGNNFTLYEMTNNTYNSLINNTINSIEIQTPNYPSGNTFTINGNYLLI